MNEVVVLTHSQGGLDIRYALAQHEADHPGQPLVAAVGTLSAPHQGTFVAQNALRWPRFLVARSLERLAPAWQREQHLPVAPADAVASLQSLLPGQNTPPVSPDIPFFSVAAFTGDLVDPDNCTGGMWSPPVSRDFPSPLLFFGRSMIAYEAGTVDNDGIVPTASMRAGTFLGCVATDHFDLLGLGPRVEGDLYKALDSVGFEVELVKALTHVAQHGRAAMDEHLFALASMANAEPLHVDEALCSFPVSAKVADVGQCLSPTTMKNTDQKNTGRSAAPNWK